MSEAMPHKSWDSRPQIELGAKLKLNCTLCGSFVEKLLSWLELGSSNKHPNASFELGKVQS